MSTQKPPGIVPNMEEIAKQIAAQQAMPQQLPVELWLKEAAIKMGKHPDGSVRMEFHLPIGIAVIIPFSEEGWRGFVTNAEKLNSKVAIASSLPR